MACKCKKRPRIISNVVRSMNESKNCCVDVCANPIYDDPYLLGLYAPLIYDEIGVNLCATFTLPETIPTTFPAARSARIEVVDADYTYGAGNVQIDTLTGRPNCYRITLSNMEMRFVVRLYDESCRVVGTLYPTATYLPTDTTDETYDEDTNPSSVELEIFAPYGISYTPGTLTTDPLTPAINYIGQQLDNNMIRQGINLTAMSKLLDFDADNSTITVGLTLVLQSLYFAGYHVKSAGKIEIPRGSIDDPETSDCMSFVRGDLLNLDIKPLNLKWGDSQDLKEPCEDDCPCGGCPGTVKDEEQIVTT